MDYSIFQEKIIQRSIPEGGCWIWHGNKVKPGNGFVYGIIVTGSKKDNSKKSERAHRVSYKAFIGDIPNSLLVCHTCDVPLCINPDHLFLGTYADNNADRARKGRSAFRKGEANPFAIITDEIALQIISEPEGIKNMALAKKYNLNHRVVYDIRTGKRWGHLRMQSSK